MMENRFGVAAVTLAAVVLVVAGCSMFGGSPMATFKSFFEASQKKDVAAMKKTLSKGTMAMMEKTAQAQNKTLDEAMKELDFSKENKNTVIPETRNEKIEGDSATIEVKNDETNEWNELPFVKEDGEWKIALDKFVEQMMEKLKDKLPKP